MAELSKEELQLSSTTNFQIKKLEKLIFWVIVRVFVTSVFF